ncbi:MAG: hypothetical protein NTU41_03725 [Chloroflexi bacterium]|nr:hypothetical protein [Chloroflexota bacterium]
MIASDLESMSQGLRRLLGNPALDHKMVVLGRRRVEEGFDIIRATGMLSALHEEVTELKGMSLI